MYYRYCLKCLYIFFNKKTGYERRISDCSSDVCSSDLKVAALGRELVVLPAPLVLVEALLQPAVCEQRQRQVPVQLGIAGPAGDGATVAAHRIAQPIPERKSVV